MAQYVPPPMGRRRAASISNLILRRGDIQSRGALVSGNIWGNALRNVGAIAGQALQQREERKNAEAAAEEERQVEEAFGAAFEAPETWESPQAAVKAFTSAGVTPREAFGYAKTMETFKELKAQPDPVKAREGLPGFADMFMRLSPERRAGVWGALRETLLASNVGSEEAWPVEYSPDLDQDIEALRKPETPKAPLTGEAGYIQRTYGDNPTPEQFLEGRSAFAKAGRAPEGPAEADEGYYLAPEGVVLSGLPIGDKNKVQRQAREQGIPAFQTGKQQELGILLAGIHAEALELHELLQRPDVAMSIGPFMGNITALAGRVSDELPPKVRRAAQLMYALSDTELRKRSGAQITEAEMKRLLRFVFDPTRPLDHNILAAEGMLKSSARDYKALSGVDPPGQTASGDEDADDGGGTPIDTSSWNLPGVTVTRR